MENYKVMTMIYTSYCVYHSQRFIQTPEKIFILLSLFTTHAKQSIIKLAFQKNNYIKSWKIGRSIST